MKKYRQYSHLTHRIQALEKTFSHFQVHIPGYLNYSGQEYPFYVLNLTEGKKPFQQNKTNICISAGIHGDEPAGVEALLSIIESEIFFERYLNTCDFMVFPCINPAGFEYDQRGNPDGVDLNRQFNFNSPPLEVNYIKEFTKNIPFSLHIDLHEDVDTEGFYLYEIVQDGIIPFGEKIINAVKVRCPINAQEMIEGRMARNGVIRREEQNSTSRFQDILESNLNWPLAIYFYSKGTSHALTFETPVKLKMAERVEIHKMAFFTALEALIHYP